MNAEMANKVVNYLAALPKIKDVRPVSVTLGEGSTAKTYYGARYTSINEYTASMMACTHNGVKPGTEYTDDRIYLLGQRPLKFKKRSNFCFPFEGHDWYIGGYYEGTHPNEYHPFGSTFSMHEWNVLDGSKIDTYERKPYARVAMTLTVLDTAQEIKAT